MPRKKNQHYVPIHYLRAWQTDERTSILPLEHGQSFNEEISDICSRPYFYGNPPTVEDSLENIESYHAQPLNQLRNGSAITELSNTDLQLLRSFITTQRTRTKSMRTDIEGGESFLREGIQRSLEKGELDGKIEWLSELNETEKEEALTDAVIKNVHHFLLIHGIFGFLCIQDLEAVLLQNTAENRFITSDAPIVHDNPAFKDARNITRTGVANSGIQLFCPIAPRQLLVLYDPAVYRFDCHDDQGILVQSNEVVNQLNLLQLHNAHSIILGQADDEEYLQELHRRRDEFRSRREMKVQIDTSLSEGTVQSVPPYQVPKSSPQLPFYKTRDRAPYQSPRPMSRPEQQKSLVRRIGEDVGLSFDIGFVYSVQVLEEILNLQEP